LCVILIEGEIVTPSEHAGEFVMKLLAEQKLTQVDIQLIMEGTSELVNHIVQEKLKEARVHLIEHGCSHVEVIENLKKKTDTIFGHLFWSP
jgi:hypothetical protein